MEITSFIFIAISVITVFIYYYINHDYRTIFLAVLSGLFIMSYSINLFAYVLTYSFVNYWIGKKIVTAGNRKTIFVLGVIINISQLVLLKYTSFAVNPILTLFNIKYDLSIVSEYIIPIGVSFFTLQAIGYLINVKMEWEKPEERFLPFLLYICFFPKFLSGPIERSNHFLPQLKTKHTFKSQSVTNGFRLILFGLFKKLVIANRLGDIVNGCYSSLDAFDEYSLWIVLLIQPLYLYYDFSGYTDIAIGLAKAFGIELLPNFNRPFLSENVTTFWKRFHISLASWFHDYVFIRTIFKTRRWGQQSTTFALFVTWVLFGIWHGAGWNFMLLGLIQGIAIYYEYSSKKWRIRIFSRLPNLVSKWIGRIVTYLFYAISLVFFFSNDIYSTLAFFSALPVTNWAIPSDSSILILMVVLMLAIIYQFIEILDVDYHDFYRKIEVFWLRGKFINKILRWLVYIAVIILILFLGYSGQGFVYFQF